MTLNIIGGVMIVKTKEREGESSRVNLKRAYGAWTSDDLHYLSLSHTFSSVYFGACNNPKEHCDLNNKK
jgi:hypothetical protein